jgi:hypothetical protein
MTAGTLRFGTIHRLPDQWWTSPPPTDPAAVWKAWDRDTYYVWGANSDNYQGIPMGHSLKGGGMAGVQHGPTEGRAHPHYVGVITMAEADLPLNDAVFDVLKGFLAKGQNVVIPTYRDEFSLGTGIGASMPAPEWTAIQTYLLTKIHELGKTAATTDIPLGTFWPDCRNGRKPYVIAELDDLMTIVNTVLTTKAAANG